MKLPVSVPRFIEVLLENKKQIAGIIENLKGE
jgi:hypothetical protein